MTQKPNALYYGDNLDILRTKIASESVDLCYIDPPFNSNRNYFQIYNRINEEADEIKDKAQAQAFIDTWQWRREAIDGYNEITDLQNLYNHRFSPRTVAVIKGLHEILGEGGLLAYIVSMTLRITEIHRVLKPHGSFYLHCDPTTAHYLKLVLDSVFCEKGGEFRNEIIWCYRRWTATAHRFQKLHDTIFYYSKSQTPLFNPQWEPYGEWIKKDYKYVDAETGKKWRWHTVKGHRYKVFLEDESRGVKIGDWWKINPIGSTAKERLGYPTQKPEALLERIIQASSNPGDVVLDAYCGCGTTVAVAQRLERRWIGIDITYQSIGLILKRLEDKYPGDQWLALRATILLDGMPRDLDAARALAHRQDDRTRKEFEKWAILTYANNQAMIHDKKGADGGVDGISYFLRDKIDNQEIYGKIIYQVKSGAVGRATIASLKGDMEREKADMAVLITLAEPTPAMITEAQLAGNYTLPLGEKKFDRVQIVTIQQILGGAMSSLARAARTVKSAAPVPAAQSDLLD
ncbi:MAG: DNA methyltransferase [Candidatus Symbiobacter sp.]|nr:DNA methyltransferase [Candidatus Symbiobacter sp.]